MHMVAARHGFEGAMVGTGWTTSRSDCINRVREHHSHLVEGWLPSRKAAWALSECTTTDSIDYACSLPNALA